MIRRLLLMVAYCLALTGYCDAQYIIKGVVTDTLNSMPLPFSSVVLLRSADSVIETFGRTNGSGQVQLNVPKEGKYLIRASAPGFVDYLDAVQVKAPVTDLGIMVMVSKERVLKEFVFTRQIAAIKIKGDTTEYVADSFKTKENATVEDLLKKLPGIQVDKNGKITAQGEEVKKILVDGEEFFSDDPKVVTQGLQAGALDKVQVFDKKSDQAEFTGIDDGQKTKTINLELKDDKKKGYFGKLDMGGGSDGYYQNQGMINAFKGKRQFSAFAIVSNTDKAGLGYKDNEKFGTGGNTEITEDGGVVTYYSGSDDDIAGWSGKYEGEGLPKTWTGGMHYADKWNEDKDHFSANYRYAQQNLEVNGQTITNNPLYVQTATKNQFSKGDKNVVNGLFEWKTDTSLSLKLSVDAGNKTLQTFSNFDTKTNGADGNEQNENLRTIHSNSNGVYVNSSVLLRKKFAKKGRTLSLDVRENYKDTKADGSINSILNFATAHSPGGLDSSVTTNQAKDNTSNTLSFSSKVNYTEPLSKVSFIVVDYSLTMNNSTSKNLSRNIDPTGAIGAIDSIYSSDYKYNILVNRGGLNYKYVDKAKKKITFSVGADISNASYQQSDALHAEKAVKTNYLNIFPSLSFDYALKKQTSLSFTYNGNTRQPSITEVQTLLQNIDPLNQTIGNPKLKQEFDNRFGIRYNSYKALTSQYTWLSASFRNSLDAIATSQAIDNTGSKTTFTNVDGNYGANLYMGGGFKLKKPAIYIGGQLSTSISHTLDYINGLPNVSDNNSYGITPYFNYEKEGKYEFNFGPGFTYNDNKSSISKYSSNYWMMDNDFSFSWQLPKKFEIGSSVNVLIRQQTAIFNKNNNVVKWNAYVSKKFLKNGQLETKFTLYDILDQNLGFNRESQNGIITETTYNTIRRYAMLNIIWNFTHTPGSTINNTSSNDD